jgi:hypothetical protein
MEKDLDEKKQEAMIWKEHASRCQQQLEGLQAQLKEIQLQQAADVRQYDELEEQWRLKHEQSQEDFDKMVSQLQEQESQASQRLEKLLCDTVPKQDFETLRQKSRASSAETEQLRRALRIAQNKLQANSK